MSTRKPIGLFYGSSTCYTEFAGEKIRDAINSIAGENIVDIFNIADTPIIEAAFYDHLIMGIPTWDYGELQEDWEDIWEEIEDLELHGKTVALYGLGDQLGYPEWFLDAMGYLHEKLKQQGAKFVGYWPTDGFQYEGSKATTEDGKFFVGLALDEENQFDKSEARINEWSNIILKDFGLC